MAGEIEQAHATLLLQRIAESGDRLLHLGLVGVGLQGDGKTGLFQGLGDRFGIVDGVLEGAKRIIGIADDQRRARLGRLRLGERKREEQRDQTKTDRYETHRADSTANRAGRFQGLGCGSVIEAKAY